MPFYNAESPKKLPQVISVENFNELLRHTKKKHHRLAFKLGFLCGLRVSEIVNLKLEDVDYNRRSILIKQGKGGKDRYVSIPKPLVRDLKNLPIGIGIRALQTAINRLSLKVLGKRIHTHTLRHSSATFYLSQGMNIREVQQLLGHSNIQTTQIYTHVTTDDIKKKMDEIWK